MDDEWAPAPVDDDGGGSHVLDDGVAWPMPVDDRWLADCGAEVDGGGAEAEPDAATDGGAGGAAGIIGELLSAVTRAAGQSQQAEEQ